MVVYGGESEIKVVPVSISADMTELVCETRYRPLGGKEDGRKRCHAHI
jgi:hypothetical protein